MKAKHLSVVGMSLALTILASWIHAEPRLNGLAINSEFGKERFIAALYTDNRSTSVDDLLRDAVHRRMESKVIADSISARSINSMWIEGAAMNTPGAALEAEADNLANLNNMVRRRLRTGDVMAFDAVPGNGMSISLNGVELGHIESNEFFNMLLRTWIGNIPLSTDFKANLMAGGDIDEDLALRYATIAPTAERIAAVQSWINPATDDASPITQSSSEQEIMEPPASPDTPSVAATSEDESEPGAEADSESASPAPIEELVLEDTDTPESESESESDEVEEVMVTAESLLIRQRYISDVLHQTLQNMRYPRRALERNQQGSIRLAVTVRRNGELDNVQILEESAHNLLNREATASVERASPFPAVPAEITGESLSFAIPVTFQLQ